MKISFLLIVCIVLFCGATCSPLVINYEVKPEILHEENNRQFLLNNHRQSIRLSFRQYHYYGNDVNNVFMARLENHSSDTLFTDAQPHFLRISGNDGQIDTAKLNAQIAAENNYVLPHAEILFYASYRNARKTKAKEFYSAAKEVTLQVCLEYRAGHALVKDMFHLKAETNN